MVLPASGNITFYQICDEFGLARTSVFPADFYGKGGAPATGALSFADFYGRSGAPTFNPVPAAYGNTGSPSFNITASQLVTWTYTKGASVVADVASGATATSITFTNNSSVLTQNITVVATHNGVTYNWSATLSSNA